MPTNYNRGRYYTQSTSSRLMDSQEAHGKTLEELRLANKEITAWKAIAISLWRDLDLTEDEADMLTNAYEQVARGD